MKVIFLSTLDAGGGAAIAAFRLHMGILDRGVDSQMLVQIRTRDEQTITGPDNKLIKALAIARPDLEKMILSFYPKRDMSMFSPAMIPGGLPEKVAGYDPDIIHMHWVADGFVNIPALAKFNKPIVWTLHDAWAFTGGCHYFIDCIGYQQSCGKCPCLGSYSDHDLSRWIWKRKKKAWLSADLTIATPSRWLAECARKSSLLQSARIEVIPNGLDLNIYKPIDKNIARTMFNLPISKKVILFGAMNGVKDRRKGFQELRESMLILAREHSQQYELVVFGSSKPSEARDFGFITHYIGKLFDDVSLAALYSAADVFVAPSIQENLANTVMEALACGTPCVAFHIGGMPDMIEHQRNGYLAKPYEPEDLAQGIVWVLENESRWRTLSLQARRKVENEFSLEKIADRYVELYRSAAVGG